MKNNYRGYKPEDRMRDLVRDNSSLILIMGRFGISLGFGEKSVREVCHNHHVDEKTFLDVVNFVVNGNANSNSISLQSLIGYYVNKI